MRLELTGVACGYGGTRIVEAFTASVASGHVLCLLGPNGVGKTTLLKCLLRTIPLLDGRIAVDGRDVHTFSTKAYAMLVAYVPQTHTPPFAFRVFDVVGMGRAAHQGLAARLSREDEGVIHRCMEQLGILSLANRVYTELSGGERQMVLIARALAQEPAFLLMDEPMSNLDFGNQARTLATVAELSGQGIGIVMTTHHPDHIFMLDADAALMLPGHQYLTGKADAVVTEENLRHAYGIDVAVVDASYRGTPMRLCRPIIGTVNRSIVSSGENISGLTIKE